MRRCIVAKDAEAKNHESYKSVSRANIELHIELLIDLVEQQTDVDLCQSIE